MAEPARRRLSNHKELTRRLGPLHRRVIHTAARPRGRESGDDEQTEALTARRSFSQNPFRALQLIHQLLWPMRSGSIRLEAQIVKLLCQSLSDFANGIDSYPDRVKSATREKSGHRPLLETQRVMCVR